MEAGPHNLKINQRAEFHEAITWKNTGISLSDWANYAAKAQVRTTAQSPDLVCEITCTLDPMVVGRIIISLTKEQTALLTPTGNGQGARLSYVWDFFVGPIGDLSIKLLKGSVYVEASVTENE
jgi:hypothetical protein